MLLVRPPLSETSMKMESRNGEPGDLPQKYFIIKVQLILMFLESSLLYFFQGHFL